MVADERVSTEMDQRAALRLTSILGELDELRRRAATVSTTVATEGSTAARDRCVSRHARFTVVLATQAVAVAVDHLSAWRMIAAAGLLPNYAPMTLLRTAVECGALCRWLVDGSITPLERVARALAAQLNDYEQRHRFEAAIDAPEPPLGSGKSGASRAAALVASREADGIPVLRFPGPTVLTRTYGDEHHRDPSWLYRLLSASAHGKTWSLMGMSLGSASEVGEGIQRGLVTGSDTVLVGSTRMAFDAIAVALTDLERYLGMSSK